MTTHPKRRITRLLVANRGEIACRIIRTARQMGITTVAVYSDTDRTASFVAQADLAVALGGQTGAESYLRKDLIIGAARAAGADAIHPGYGFLSENPEFAEECAAAGIVFVGPTAESIRAMGLKDRAKQIAAAAGVPVLPGLDVAEAESDDLAELAAAVGFPMLVKATAGGGGKGMRLVADPADLAGAITGARREAAGAFGDSAVILERYLTRARHIEIQVFGDTHGAAIHLGERECSIQRRHQKVVEEAPSPAVDAELRNRMGSTAVGLVRELGYVGAGTVEFLLDDETGEFFFLEMNTRLQVEHPVTEEVTGLDLVRLQLAVAAGHPLGLTQDDVVMRGHAVEVRLYAEDPARDYLPTPGTVHRFEFPGRRAIRYELGLEGSGEVSPFYDPMMAKIIAHSDSRAEAAAALASALDAAQIHGIITNRESLSAILRDADYLAGATTTDFLDTHPGLLDPPAPTPATVHLAAAVATTVARRRAGDALTAFAAPGFRNLVGAERTPEQWARAGAEAETVRYRLSAASGDTVLELDYDGDTNELALSGLGPDAVRVTYGGVDYPCRTATYSDGTVWVNDPCAQSSWTPQPRLPDSGTGAASGHGPLSEIPGTVVDVLVEVGDTVVGGQPLVVIEAMKMEHSARAAGDGIVERINVAVGQFVGAKVELVTISAGEDR